MEVASFTANFSLLSDAPSQNEDTNEEPAVIAKTPQHHLGKAKSTRMKPGSAVRLDKNTGKSSHRQTFAALEADSSDEISEEDDRLELPPSKRRIEQQSKRLRGHVRGRQRNLKARHQSRLSIPTLKAKARKRG
ncbi:hypothetical protein FIBSPDRAFT_851236 [Athelia psychrophila]|uniref:Uncharacterized protein n=1 Tax=Athelia psychrophila TaxID=1759441 RepID=A0A166SN67_9AGAM|nr:hypothetical protein FIBSPDRAFT_851236 [Fibularhizoctonia sp. CBS 109695]